MSSALIVALIAVAVCGIALVLAINAPKATKDPPNDVGTTSQIGADTDCGDGAAGCD